VKFVSLPALPGPPKKDHGSPAVTSGGQGVPRWCSRRTLTVEKDEEKGDEQRARHDKKLQPPGRVCARDSFTPPRFVHTCGDRRRHEQQLRPKAVFAMPMEPANTTSDVLNGVGIAMGCSGSIFINIGNNLQALGHHTPNPSLVGIGTSTFLCGSLCVFAAFAFAPASVVAPLESLQFVVNLAFHRWVNQTPVTFRMALGTLLILVGTFCAVYNGPMDGTVLISIQELEGYWASPGWLGFLGVILAIAAAAEAARSRYATPPVGSEFEAQRASTRPLWVPVAFALSSTLLGTQVPPTSSSHLRQPNACRVSSLQHLASRRPSPACALNFQ
jgi:hypothetical protein